VVYRSLWKTHRRASYLPYLPPDTDERAPPYNPSQTGRYSIYLPRKDGRLSWLWRWLYTDVVCLSADSQPSKYKPLEGDLTGSWTCGIATVSPTFCRYDSKPHLFISLVNLDPMRENTSETSDTLIYVLW